MTLTANPPTTPSNQQSSPSTHEPFLAPVQIGNLELAYLPGRPQTTQDQEIHDLLTLRTQDQPLCCLRVPTVNRTADTVPLLAEAARITFDQALHGGDPQKVAHHLATMALHAGGSVSVADPHAHAHLQASFPEGQIHHLTSEHLPPPFTPLFKQYSSLIARPPSGRNGHISDVAVGVYQSRKGKGTSEVKRFCDKHFGTDFDTLRIGSSAECLKSVLTHDGTSVIPFVVFEPDPTNLSRVRRTFGYAIANGKAILLVSHGESMFLSKTLDGFERKPSHVQKPSSSGALLLDVFLEALHQTGAAVSGLDSQVEDLNNRFKRHQLSESLLTKESNELTDSLKYLQRKLNEMIAATGAALEMAVTKCPGIAAQNRPEWNLKLKQLTLSAKRVWGHADENAKQLEQLKGNFELRAKGITDSVMKVFTVFIGYSVPPIVTDIFSKTFLHHESPKLMISAFIASVIAHYAMYRKWWSKV